MSLESCLKHLAAYGAESQIIELDQSSATVELAAEALGCLPEHIAKSLAFLVGETPVVVVVAGDAKVDNSRYKKTFHKKAKMLSAEETLEKTGHPVGGVCPFGLNEGVELYFDESLKRFAGVTLYPAGGSRNSAVKTTLDEMQRLCGNPPWVDVCKGWRPEEREAAAIA